MTRPGESHRLTEEETQGSNVYEPVETPERRNGLDRWLKTLKPDDTRASLRTRKPTGRKTSGALQGSEDLRISKVIDQRQEGRLSQEGKTGDGYRRGKSFEGCSRRWERPNPRNPRGNRG